MEPRGLDRSLRLLSGCLGATGKEPSIHKNIVTQIRKASRKKYSAEEKIRIVLEGLRGEIPISELCRREGIAPTMYYRWSKAFLDAGKNGLIRETLREATTEEVRGLREENTSRKKALAEAILDVMWYKKSLGDPSWFVEPFWRWLYW
jgi:transposase